MKPQPAGAPAASDRLDRTRFPLDEWALREVTHSEADLGASESVFAVGNGYVGLRANPEEGRPAVTHGTYVNGLHETSRIRHAEDAYGFATVGQTIVPVPDAKVIRLYVDDEPLLVSVADLESYERTLDFREGLLRRNLVWRTLSGKLVRISSTRMVSFPERHLALLTYEFTMVDEGAAVAVTSQVLNRQDGANEYHDSSIPSPPPGSAPVPPDGPPPGGALAVDDAGEPVPDPRQAQVLVGRVLQPQIQRHTGGRYVLGYRVANSGMSVAVAVDHVVESSEPLEIDQSGVVRPDGAEHIIRAYVPPGCTVRIAKFVSYHTSRSGPASELAVRCERTVDRAMAAGTEAVQAAQRDWLAAFWERSDVVVHGCPAIQQAVRWCLFQVAQAVGRAEGVGIPAKGVTGSGYGGHYFWDSEIYVLPFCTYTTPRFARNALRFRYTMLPAARRRARELSSDGALYPWRTINGEEASAYYAAGTAQYHIDADIAYALSQYLWATRDHPFLEREGIDILVETARMWADLGFWRTGGDERFHIHGVTGPDEYTTVVNDNLFTNVMARFNLRAAAGALADVRRRTPAVYERVVRRLALRDGEPEEWLRAAEHMAIPYDARLHIHPQDEQFLEKEVWDLAATPADKFPLLLHYHPLVIYRYQVLKQADVVLAQFLRGVDFTPEQRIADFDYYDPLTTGDSSLSAVTQASMAAEVGYQELAQRYFADALYLDLADLHRNTTEGVHIASAGGVWSALVFGFGGMRDADGQISFDPRLPELWEGLSFPVTLGGTRIRVDLRHKHISFTVEDGTEAEVTVRGELVKVRSGAPVAVPLARGTEPRLIGAPTVEDLTGARRADGTVITAYAPQASPDARGDSE
jgi:alpha,alpha-trehalose phosphorylase